MYFMLSCGGRRKKIRGFSIIETLIALAIGSIAALVAVGIFSSGIKAIRGSGRTERLHTNASWVGERFAYWARRGESATLPDLETVLFDLPGGVIKTLSTAGGAFTEDGTPLTSGEVRVSRLRFEKIGGTVRIAFTLELPGTGEAFSGTTTAAMRNEL